MKTIKYFLAVLLLSGLFISCQKDVIQPDQSDAAALKTTSNTGIEGQLAVPINVTYAVTVTLNDVSSFCGNYMVKLTTENGRTIAPPQPYVLGKDVYIFAERTRLISATRVAVFIEESGSEDNCAIPLFASPDTQRLNLADEVSFPFYLFPTTKPPK